MLRQELKRIIDMVYDWEVEYMKSMVFNEPEDSEESKWAMSILADKEKTIKWVVDETVGRLEMKKSFDGIIESLLDVIEDMVEEKLDSDEEVIAIRSEANKEKETTETDDDKGAEQKIKSMVERALEKAYERADYWQYAYEFAEEHDQENAEEYRQNAKNEGEKVWLLKAILNEEESGIDVWA